jgi:hypothetical protein
MLALRARRLAAFVRGWAALRDTAFPGSLLLPANRAVGMAVGLSCSHVWRRLQSTTLSHSSVWSSSTAVCTKVQSRLVV